ncbi:MAG TPA: hypothetical protein VNE16_00530 [Vicinamibacterales bacterium]|nr:hypothetical protein [Vicinamibacterales bacterium]
MNGASTFKTVLKRGALVTAANWPVVLIEFIADTTFKGLLAVPVIGAAVLVAMLLGADIRGIVQGSLRHAVVTVAGALAAEPVALGAFVLALALVLVGGSVLMFLVKGGVVDVLVAGSVAAGAIERPPLRLASFQRAARFSLERFTGGCRRLFPAYLVLGLLLMLVYGVSGGLDGLALYAGYAALGHGAPLVGWTLLAIASVVLLAAWIAVVNLIYLLAQIVIATDDGRPGLRRAFRTLLAFLRGDLRDVAAVFGVWAVLVVLATVASALAWSGVGLIAFVPVVGIAVVPLQLAALVVRGVLFDYLGLTALSAYLALYRSYLQRVSGDGAAGPVPGLESPVGRTA